MNQRSNREILSALDGVSLTPKLEKKALVKNVLEFGPLPRIINFPKPVPAYRRFLNYCLPSRTKYRGVYASFEEARAHAPRRIPLGFDHDEIALGYKNQRFLLSDYPAAFWLRESMLESTKDGAAVLDLGGSVGISFYSWERYFQYPPNLRWTVCEVPAVVQAGKKIALERNPNEDRLHFISEIEPTDDCDCFLASGSPQYLEAPVTDYLKRLARLPRHLIVNRVPLHSRRECITLQNIRWAVAPYRVFQRDAFIAEFEALGYTVVDAWIVPDHSCWIPLYPEFSVAAYSGLYFRREQEVEAVGTVKAAS